NPPRARADPSHPHTTSKIRGLQRCRPLSFLPGEKHTNIAAPSGAPQVTSQPFRSLGRIASVVAFAAVLTLGIATSLTIGLTWDEGFEQHTFKTILGAAMTALNGDLTAVQSLATYRDRYHGIGFHLFAYGFQLLLQPSLKPWLGVDYETAILLAKHVVVFGL